MSRRGKNIFKRKDGRWEGRYISSYMENGRAKYSSVYAYSYVECSQKLQLAKVDLLPKNDPITVSELFSVSELHRCAVRRYACWQSDFIYNQSLCVRTVGMRRR